MGILIAFGMLDLAPDLLPRLGLRSHSLWPFVAAAILAAANIGFLAHARLRARSAPSHWARANLWAQIAVDLAVLTLVVHDMGSLETYAPFAYLFHIVLACIFFPRSWSLAVTLLASALFIACVGAEETGLLPEAGIYATPILREQLRRVPGARLLAVLWAVLTWGVVWYLASHLSDIVRERENELAEANRLLVRAQEERMRHMLVTTHELKAPFAAIHANVQLLLKEYCGSLSDAAKDVLARIAARCRRLGVQIQEMVQLANLRSAVAERQLPIADIDLSAWLASCVAALRPAANGLEIRIIADLRPARTTGVVGHIKMLFSNLLANAIQYSRPRGRVWVSCGTDPAEGPWAEIEDEGIGIEPEKLPRIFDIYYRTEEAVRHHPESTGVGLAIVRHVAEMHGIRVRVESAPGEGTRFRLVFPPSEGRAESRPPKENLSDGLPVDR